jgi:hypothetical protein
MAGQRTSNRAFSSGVIPVAPARHGACRCLRYCDTRAGLQREQQYEVAAM